MDRTDTARRLLDLPFHRANDIEVVEVTAAGARTRWPFDPSLVGNPEVPALHGGVVAAMADLTGAAPFVGDLGRYTPTIDLRVDYLSHSASTTSRTPARPTSSGRPPSSAGGRRSASPRSPSRRTGPSVPRPAGSTS